MAITRNNLSMKMNGRVGAFSYYTTSGGRQVARIANNGSNYGESAKRTVAMQKRRTRWGNVVSFFSANKDLMARAFERKSANLSDYNRFMQLNIPIASVALTKDAFLKGWCILQEYTIADGSLPEIKSSLLEEDGFVFDLLCTLDAEFANYTIGQVSVNLMDNNPQILEGDQITFINWTNSGVNGGGVRLYRHLCEMTIDRNSPMQFSELRYSQIVASTGQKVILKGQGEVFGQAIIHSRSVGGSLLVSPAKIVLSSTTFVDQFSNADAVKQAIASYGVDAEKLLEPGSPEQNEPRPLPLQVTIKVINNPVSGGSFTIVNEDTMDSAVNVLSVSPGTRISLEGSANSGFSLGKIEPNYPTGEPFVVNESITITANWVQNT